MSTHSPNLTVAEPSRSDEREPLLGTQRTFVQNEGASFGLGHEGTGEIEDALPKAPEARIRSSKAYILYGVLGIAGAVLLGLLIKGFLDTDDVDVSVSKNIHALDLPLRIN